MTSQPPILAGSHPWTMPGIAAPLPEVVRTADTALLPSDGGQPAVVALPDEIDILNAHRVGEELAAACLLGARVVIADMTATTMCDNAGLRMLVLARRQAAALGAELRVLVPSPRIVQIMKTREIDAELSLYRSLDEALADPGAPVGGPVPAGSNDQLP